jgi:hypothetical protein
MNKIQLEKRFRYAREFIQSEQMANWKETRQFLRRYRDLTAQRLADYFLQLKNLFRLGFEPLPWTPPVLPGYVRVMLRNHPLLKIGELNGFQYVFVNPGDDRVLGELVLMSKGSSTLLVDIPENQYTHSAPIIHELSAAMYRTGHMMRITKYQ